MPIVGVVGGGGGDTSTRYITAFRKGLNENGIIEVQNVTVEYYWLRGQAIPRILSQNLRGPSAPKPERLQAAEMILARTTEGRKRAQARGVRFGRKPKLSTFQIPEGLARREAGEGLV